MLSKERHQTAKGPVCKARLILPEGRSAIVKNLSALEEIRDTLSAVENAFKIEVHSEDFSDQTGDFDVPIVQTKQSKFSYAQDVVSEQVTAQQAVALAAEPFRECVEMYGDYTWRGITNAAYEIARSLGIDDQTWATACDPAALISKCAALCIILIHRNLGMPTNSEQFPRDPGAWVEKFAAQAVKDEPCHLAALCLFMFGTGARRGEA